jgi:hypothetical protein
VIEAAAISASPNTAARQNDITISPCTPTSIGVVLKKCRPDQDITRPQLKGAWGQGRKELFYPVW